MSTHEEACYELFVFERALNEGDIVESFKLLGNGLCLLADMGSDVKSSYVSVSPCLFMGMSRLRGGFTLLPMRHEQEKQLDGL